MHSTKVLRAWEFVASTLDLKVGNIGRTGTERYDASRIAKPKARAEFDRRLDDLTHALNAGEVPVQQHYAYGPAAWTVLAGDAAEFGRRQGWGMPSKIKALKRPSERGTAITEPAAQITTGAAEGKGTEPGEQVSVVAIDGITRHSISPKRRNVLDAEIEAAKHVATHPDDAHAVYAVLRQWAKERKAPFIGFVEGDGIKYETQDDEVKIFTYEALRKRMKRAHGR